MTHVHEEEYRRMLIRAYAIPVEGGGDAQRFDVYRDYRHVFSLKEVISQESVILRRAQGRPPGPTAFEQGLARVKQEIDAGLPHEGQLITCTTKDGNYDHALDAREPLGGSS